MRPPSESSRSERLRLRTLLFLGLAVLASAPVLVLGWIEARRWEEVQLSQADREALLAGGTLADNVTQILESYGKLAELSAASLRASGGLYSAARHRLLAELRAQAPGATVAYVADARGDVVESDPPPEGGQRLNYGDRAYFQAAMRDQRLAISEVVVGKRSGQRQVVFAAPVVRDGVALGIVSVSVGLQTFAAQAERLTARHPELDAVILDAAGNVVSAPVLEASEAPRYGTLPLYAESSVATGELRIGERADGLKARAAVVPARHQDSIWRVVVSRPEKVALAQAGRARARTVITAALGLLACLALAVFFASWLARPLDGAARLVAAVGKGELFHTATPPSELQPLETARLVFGLQRMLEDLRQHTSALKGVSKSVGEVARTIESAGREVRRGALVSQESVDGISSTLNQMSTSMRIVGDEVADLNRHARESASTLLAVARGNEEIAHDAEGVAERVVQTRSALDVLSQATAEIARNMAELDRSTAESLRAVRRGETSLTRVRSSAEATALIATQTAADAAGGVEALEATRSGVDNIRLSWSAAAQELDALIAQISGVSGVLDVIESIAKKTNLLALNAAIIAAQAGEHGKGFAVVADEIKRLAATTANSTREIAVIVDGVQKRVRAASTTMEGGVHSVSEGLRLANEATETLHKIRTSAAQAATRIQDIVAVTHEEVRSSRSIGETIGQMAERAEAVAALADEQTKSTERITKSAHEMVELAGRMKRRTAEQAKSSQEVARAIEAVAKRASHIDNAQREQTQGTEQVNQAMLDIVELGSHLVRASDDLGSAIEALRNQADVLDREVEVFRS